MTNLEKRAREYAKRAHESIGQTRKYTGQPYIVHPAAVVALVRTVPHTEEMLCAAWLHDVVEDTPFTLLQVAEEFDWTIAGYVACLTDPVAPGVNRAGRKALARMRMSDAPAKAQTIKLADLIDNTRDIVKHDPKFAVTYLKEKRLLLEAMTRGDETLRQQAWWALNVAEEELGI